MPRPEDDDEESAYQDGGDIDMTDADVNILDNDGESAAEVADGDLEMASNVDDDGDDDLSSESNSRSSLSASDSSNLEDEDESDPIEQSYPVIVTDEAFQRLCLLQFITRHRDFIVPPQKGMLRPKADMVSLEVPIETDQVHYDEDLAHQFCDGYKKDVLQTAKKKAKRLGSMDVDNQRVGRLLEYQKLESISMPTKQSQYMVSMTCDGTIYLTTVDSILQMRHNLKYVEFAQEKDMAKGADKSRKSGDDEGAGEGRVGKAIVQTAGRNEDRETIRRLAQMKLFQEDNDEPWMDCTINSKEDFRVRDHLKGFIKKNAEKGENQTEPDRYLKQLHGNVQPFGVVIDLDKNKVVPGLSRASMGDLTLEERLKAFMINAQIARFHTIKSAMKPTGVSEEKLLDLCMQVALLVRGVWIVRSDLVYKDRMRDARCCLLAMFTRSEIVKRGQFTAIAGLREPMDLYILTELCSFMPGQGWKLLENDEEFEKTYTGLVQDQKRFVQIEAQKAEARLKAERPTPKKLIMR